jgi:hypothetical protein
MKIAVLYFCSGGYSLFWDIFSASARQHFCAEDTIHYYVFTDSISITSSDSVSVIYQQNLGWPFISLYRYRIFERISSELLDYDKVVFFNANCKFVADIQSSDFFGVGKPLLAAIHPAFHASDPKLYPYETRPESRACVNESHVYVQGALMGGDPSHFLAACQLMKQNIEADLDEGVLASVFDESHWNAYVNNNFAALQDQLQLLTPSFLYPEGWDLPFTPKIQLLEKSKHLNVGAIKGTFAASSSATGMGLKQLLLLRLKQRLRSLLPTG